VQTSVWSVLTGRVRCAPESQQSASGESRNAARSTLSQTTASQERPPPLPGSPKRQAPESSSKKTRLALHMLDLDPEGGTHHTRKRQPQTSRGARQMTRSDPARKPATSRHNATARGDQAHTV